MSVPKINFRVARTREDLERCYALVYKEWIKSNYLNEGTPFRYSLYNIPPSTTTFMGTLENELIMTATLIIDSPLGVPIDVIFPEHITSLRSKNKKIAEVSMLAFDSEKSHQFSPLLRVKILLELFYLLFTYAKNQEVQIILAKVHPKHASSYEQLRFKDFGELRNNVFVQNMPVTGKYLDIENLISECQATPDTFPCNHFMRPPTLIETESFNNPYRFNADDLKTLFVERLPILKKCSPLQLDAIQKLYPEINIDSLIF